MAIAFESISTNSAWGATGTLTITKPTGLAEGDLMVAVLGNKSVNTQFNPRSDWFSLDGVVNQITSAPGATGRVLGVQFKVADSGDVAASDFSWSGPSSESAGSIYRFSGQGPDPITVWNVDKVDDDATPSFDNGVTPVAANSFLMLVGMTKGHNAGAGAVISGYAITTNNPTWTERVDTGVDSGGDDVTLFGATAPRAEITSTGNSTVTLTGSDVGDADTAAFLIVINPITGNQSLSPDSINSTAVINTPSTTVSASLSPSAINSTAAVVEPTISLVDNPWSNVDKSAIPSWNNKEKS